MDRPRKDVRSHNNPLILEVPRSCTVPHGDRSFAVIGRKLWKALYCSIRVYCAFKDTHVHTNVRTVMTLIYPY